VACCATMLHASEPWNNLFTRTEGDRGLVHRDLKVLYKGGQPLLALPGSTRPAAICLGLYPAQTWRARLARCVARVMVQTGWRIGMQATRFQFSRHDPFILFLSEVADESETRLPEFGIFAGNPRSPGQRFMILVFAPDGTPKGVVKAGVSQQARRLVGYEAEFLRKAGGRFRGVPALRKRFTGQNVEALVLDFFPGESPRTAEGKEMANLLISWVDTRQTTSIEETATWNQLKQCASCRPLLAALPPALGGKQVCPVLHHGDFTPWNVRVSPEGNWTVLDWERGELQGLPAWDWFHFVIQRAVLVQKAGVEELLKTVRNLLANSSFRDYARLARIEGIEPALLQAYLIHLTEVIRPSEGLEQNRALLSRLQRG
jgi:hypothetical protein